MPSTSGLSYCTVPDGRPKDVGLHDARLAGREIESPTASLRRPGAGVLVSISIHDLHLASTVDLLLQSEIYGIAVPY